eukprot:PITA_14689
MVEQEMPSNRGNPTAFFAHAKRRSNAGPKGHFNGKPGSKGGRKGRCFVCNKFGHYVRECPNRRTHHMMMITIIPGATSTTTIKGMVGSMAKEKGMRNIKEMVNPLRKQGTPVIKIEKSLTSQALRFLNTSRHFTRYKEALSNLIENETKLEIILGNDATYPMKGVGNVTLKLNQGNTIHLQEVLYVPDLKKNLVSISAMEDK